MTDVNSRAGRIASLYPMAWASSRPTSGVFPRQTRLRRQGPLTNFGTAVTSPMDSGASTNAMSAPAWSALFARRIASSNPSTARASVRAMTRKSGSCLAAQRNLMWLPAGGLYSRSGNRDHSEGQVTSAQGGSQGKVSTIRIGILGCKLH
jgi:hypothetical protein